MTPVGDRGNDDKATVERKIALARAALARRDFVTAEHTLRSIISGGLSAEVQYLLGVTQARLGNQILARQCFEDSLLLQPENPAIHAGFADFLCEVGDIQSALLQYQRAIQILPNYVDAHLNLALLLRRCHELDKARQHLEVALSLDRGNASIWYAMALVLADLDLPHEAKAALHRAAAIDPKDVGIIHMQGVIETRLGGAASKIHQRAVALDPGNQNIALDYCLALVQEGHPRNAEDYLATLVASNHTWSQGQAMLSAIRWQNDGPEGFDRGYREALKKHPNDINLWHSYFSMLLKAGQYDLVLSHLIRLRSHFSSIEFDRIEAAATAQSEDITSANLFFSRFAESRDLAIQYAFMRHRLRTGDAAAAAAAGEKLVRVQGGSVAWPYLGIAWRLLEHSEWRWLENYDQFVQVYDLDEIQPDLEELAETIRRLHVPCGAPLGQTLRGGTQTEGQLLDRDAPLIKSLRAAIHDKLRSYVDALPTRDPRHPLLSSARGPIRIVGSWSNRLLDGGFHTTHTHSNGQISSAFYLSLPPSVSRGDARQEGWLHFGKPPPELRLSLEATKTVDPRPGRLVLFPSFFWHGTHPFSAGERLTIAFDATT